MHISKPLPLSLVAASATLLVSGLAAAQHTPDGLLEEKKASAGTTDVATEGFQAIEKPTDELADATELNVVAGGVLSSGNSKSLSLTGASNFKMRRAEHQFSAAAAANYGRGAAQGEKVERTVENYQARARYDYFFSKSVAGFLAASARSDVFQGLDLRLNIDPGIAYYFIDVEKHQFWGELGYDLQHDIRTRRALETEDGDILDKTATRHSARLFLGYDNKINKAAAFNAGAEYLQGLSPIEDKVTKKTNWQLNVQMGLTSSVSEDLSIATTLGLRYDNNPLPEVKNTDIVTAINIVYSLY